MENDIPATIKLLGRKIQDVIDGKVLRSLGDTPVISYDNDRTYVNLPNAGVSIVAQSEAGGKLGRRDRTQRRTGRRRGRGCRRGSGVRRSFRCGLRGLPRRDEQWKRSSLKASSAFQVTCRGGIDMACFPPNGFHDRRETNQAVPGKGVTRRSRKWISERWW